MSSTFPVLASAKREATSSPWSAAEVVRCAAAAVISLGITWRSSHVELRLSLPMLCILAGVVAAVCFASQVDRHPGSPIAIDRTVRLLRSIGVALIFAVVDAMLFPQSRAVATRAVLGFAALSACASLPMRPALRPCAQRLTGARLKPVRSHAAAKRAFDVVSALFLCMVLFPLLAIIAVAIKLETAGPVFFAHERVGLRGRRFQIVKFRSMLCSAPAYQGSPSDSRDPRITRVGRLLRRLGLDELPQLINVLRGEMSLVGPRPEMPFVVRTYTREQRVRLHAVPGITGLWQISPGRAHPIHENLQYDLYYIAHQSLLLDLAIIIRTFSSLIRGVGAI